MALAIATTSAAVFTPQRPAPQSISTKHSSVVPCFWAAAETAPVDIRQIVDAHDYACAVARQPRQPIDLRWITHLVRHEYIL